MATDYAKLANQFGGSSEKTSYSDLAKKHGGSSLPSRLEIKPPEPVTGEVPDFAKSIIDYATEPPTKEDFSLGETGFSGLTAGGVAAAAPKVLQKGGKLLKPFLPAPLKPIATGAELLGTALGKVPLYKRFFGGGATGATADVVQQSAEMAGAPRAVSIPLSIGTAGLGPTIAKPLSKLIPGATGRALRGVQTVEEMLAGQEAGKSIPIDKQKAIEENLNLVRGGPKTLEPEIRLTQGLKQRADTFVNDAKKQASDLENQAASIVQEAEKAGGKITQDMEKRIANLRTQWDSASDKLRADSQKVAKESVEAAAKRAAIIKSNAVGKTQEVKQAAEREANQLIQDSRAQADQLIKNSEKEIATAQSRIENQQNRLRRFRGAATQTAQEQTKVVGERILPTKMGEEVRPIFDKALKKIQDDRETTTKPIRDAWKNSVIAKEQQGVTYKTTKAFGESEAAIKAELIDPETRMVKVTDPKVKSQVESVLNSISPTQQVKNEAGEIVTQQLNPSVVSLDTLYRRLMDRARGLPAEGVDAIDQQLSGRLAKQVEKIIDEFSEGNYAAYKKAYSDASKPLNEFRTRLGTAVTDKPEGFDLGSYLEDLPTLGGKVFAGKPQVQQFVSLAGPEEANRLAKGYLADQIGEVTPQSIKSALQTNRDWLALPEFTQLKNNLETASKTIGKSTDQAARTAILEKALNVRLGNLPNIPVQKAATIERRGLAEAGRVESAAEKQMREIKQAEEDKVKKFGTPKTEELRIEAEQTRLAGAGEVQKQAEKLQAEAKLAAEAKLTEGKAQAQPLQAQAKEVVASAEKAKQELLKGSTEESRLRQIFFGSNENEWNALSDMVKADPKMKDAMGDAIGQLIASQPRMADRTFQEISQRLTSRGLASQQQMDQIEQRLKDVLVSPVGAATKRSILQTIFKRTLNATAGSAAGQVSELVTD